MPLADYFSRNALAAAQVLRGQDSASLQAILERHVVGVAWSELAMTTEGRALIDLLVRLLARLYPRLNFHVRGEGAERYAAEMGTVASLINPNIDITSAPPTVQLAIGREPPPTEGLTVYAGSNGWDALFGTSGPRPTGDSENPCGAGAAACFAAANLFRAVFSEGASDLDIATVFSTQDRLSRATDRSVSLDNVVLHTQSVLVGCGGVGNAAAWVLRRAPIRGRIHLVDHDSFDLGNLQRTVLAMRADEGRPKAELLAASFNGRLIGVPHEMRFAEFVRAEGYSWDRVMVAVDTAENRRAVQASLPRWIANSWTQIGDLGVAVHVFDEPEAPCLYCAYLPSGKVQNRDELVATELGVSDRVQQVRDLLYRDAPPPAELLDSIARARGIQRERLESYARQPLRVLYVEGVCGGGLVSLAVLGETPQELHVPLAHQSALAGVLLASAFLVDAAGFAQSGGTETRIDLMHSLSQHVARPVRKSMGACICKDADYLARYRAKWRNPG